jgi:2-aminoadipate transaminase
LKRKAQTSTRKAEGNAPALERLQRRAAANEHVLSFAGGLPDPKIFPRGALTRAFLRAMEASGCPALQYGWPEGQLDLREFIAERLRARGCQVGAPDVLVTSGAQQAIAIAAQLVFKDEKTIRIDPETYSGALELFRARGLHLAHALEDAKAAYVMPQITNPRGQGMSDAERRRLLAAARQGLVLIEDDAYADILFRGQPGRPLLADAPDGTLHIGTFSKSLCPGLRVGWLIAPPPLRALALEAKRESDLQANSLAQAILADYLSHDDFEQRIAKARRVYRRRAARLVDALRRHLPAWRFEEPLGGFSLWIETPEGGDEAGFLEQAIAAGTSFDPGSMFLVEPGEALRLRLSYSCLPEESIDEGARRLAKAWKSWSGNVGALTRSADPLRSKRAG